MSSGNFNKIVKTDITLAVFTATVLGYAMAFMSEQGYLAKYGIPYDFIEISPGQIFNGAVATALLLFR